ncbi:MAG: tRNA (adenosine(37)-N6)-threonylcarbamoyltransferase complex ATPase subunit type 1 TsaE [Bacteroidaceae bacterium]|nr:tRNA (adenosine(37)-N6)-threonylcarbamoyltransferase complex ATPase subunit type 1 TsaE [Bacteroidaceae bacterium]MEE0118742.1 tRNA (adenosine(37)-N6)-threonylcarbamoyltransferase complex ATPase subunit type 1 TsaE [Bacteroidaceae bacterium]
MTEILIPSLDKIADAAQEFVAQMGHRRVFAFYGGMGAGKTTFIKALCQQLGVKDAVTSPTFAIVNEYGSDIGPIYHFDFYRIKNLAEVMDLGFDDYAYSGHLCLMEWPELIEDLLPDNTVSVHIEETDNGMRKITVG